MSLQYISRCLSRQQHLLRNVSVVTNQKPRQCSSIAPRHQVLISHSTDIYENLALEDWLYENADLQSTSTLLLWHNKPAVVFGRHQNPWMECNMKFALDNDITLARRKSGGGTVYHDLGNLNCSFLKRRDLYDRKQNLELVVGALKQQWEGVNLTINCREDILMDDMFKISGTASKLGGKRTYHHFTLLMDVNKELMQQVLHPPMTGILSNATPSRPSQVSCLQTSISDLDFDTIVEVIGAHFLKTSTYRETGLQLIHPLDESRFPGVTQHLNELKSWEWIYGKTPPFTIKQKFTDSNNIVTSSQQTIEIDVAVKKGLINSIDINLNSQEIVPPRVLEMLKIGILDTRLRQNDVHQRLSQVKMDWISNDLYTVQTRQTLDWILLCVLDTLSVWRSKPNDKSPSVTHVPHVCKTSEKCLK